MNHDTIRITKIIPNEYKGLNEPEYNLSKYVSTL